MFFFWHQLIQGDLDEGLLNGLLSLLCRDVNPI